MDEFNKNEEAPEVIEVTEENATGAEEAKATVEAAPEEKPSAWLIILSVIVPLFGLIYWLVARKKDTKRAEFYCTVAIISLIVGEIVSIGLTISRVGSIVGWVLSLFGAA